MTTQSTVRNLTRGSDFVVEMPPFITDFERQHSNANTMPMQIVYEETDPANLEGGTHSNDKNSWQSQDNDDRISGHVNAIHHHNVHASSESHDRNGMHRRIEIGDAIYPNVGACISSLLKQIKKSRHSNLLYEKKLTVYTNTLELVQRNKRCLTKELHATQRNLEACKDEIFRLQPMQQVSDCSVAEEFEGFQRRVDNWLNAQFAAYDARYSIMTSENSFICKSDQHATKLFRAHPDSEEYLVKYRLNACLCGVIFSNGLSALGLPKRQISFIGRLESLMSGPEIDRGKITNMSMARVSLIIKDAATIAEWRSLTLKAVSKDTSSKSIRQQYIKSVTQHIFNQLGGEFPSFFNNQNCKQEFQRDIITPAAELAVIMQTSTTQYEISLRRDACVIPSQIHKHHLQQYILVDVRSGKVLKAENPIVFDRDGIFADYLCPLAPGLYRCESHEKSIVLKPAAHLVRLHRPLNESKPQQ